MESQMHGKCLRHMADASDCALALYHLKVHGMKKGPNQNRAAMRKFVVWYLSICDGGDEPS